MMYQVTRLLRTSNIPSLNLMISPASLGAAFVAALTLALVVVAAVVAFVLVVAQPVIKRLITSKTLMTIKLIFFISHTTFLQS